MSTFPMKLGKKPPRHDPRTLQLAHYLTNALQPPERVDWGSKVTQLGVMLNDTLGDCTIAAAGHMVQTWTANAGSQIIIPDTDIVAAYSGACGYDPADPSTDQGGIEVDVLNYWRKTGIGGRKIFAYAAQEPKNRVHVQLAVDLFGGCYLGVELPLSAQGANVWSVPPGGPVGQGAPGSLGGHAVCAVDYGPAGITVVTWGKLLTMTWLFFDTYVSEAYAILSTDWCDGTKIAPSGFDFSALQADLAVVSG